MIKISKFTVNPFGENTYVLWNETSRNAIIIDPGMMTASERTAVVTFIKKQRLIPTQILLTHAHIDHAASASWVSKAFNAPISANDNDTFLAQNLPQQAAYFHLKLPQVEPLKINNTLDDGDVVNLDDTKLSVITTPGHTPGSIAIYVQAAQVVFTGDSIFAGGSIGRTDLPGGSQQQLLASLHKIAALPPATIIAPGHGETSVLQDEFNFNPYLR